MTTKRDARRRKVSTARRVFVDRERELAALVAAYGHARQGEGRLVLVTGAAGIGKTRLAEELVRQVVRGRARAVWGRCHEDDAAPACWPWTQVLRACVDWSPEVAPDVAAEVAPLLGAPGAAQGEPGERFRRADAVSRFLAAVTRRRPLIVVLDDLHWADAASLHLLEFVARDIGETGLLLLGAYRDDETPARPEVAQRLARLARLSERIHLDGLPQAEVGRLVRHVTGQPVPARLAAAIHRRSGGNPFLVDVVARSLAARDAAQVHDDTLGVPAAVRDMVRHRLSGLSGDTRALVALAAAAGESFDERLLAVAAAVGPERVRAHLEAACAAGMVQPVDDPGGGWTFAHALLRDAVYEDIAAAERRRLHRRLADSLAATAPTEPGPLVALAHHRFAAGDGSAAALEQAAAAAKRATAGGAHEQAARLLERALACAEPDVLAPEQRCRLLLAAGRAWGRADQWSHSRPLFLAAAATARAMGSARLLADAALGYCGRWIALGRGDARGIALLEEALAALPDAPELRARLLARLAVELAGDDARARRRALADEAIAVARAAHDPATFGNSLYIRHFVLVEPECAPERLAVASEIVRLGEESGSAELAARGLSCVVEAQRERGDPAALAEARAAAERAGAASREPGAAWAASVWRLLDALVAGRLPDAEALIATIAALGDRFDIHETAPVVMLATFAVRREQGRLADVEALVDRLASEAPALPLLRYLRACLHAEAGREHEARDAFELVAAGDFADLPLDVSWHVALSLAAETVLRLADARRAALLVPRLERLLAGGVATSSAPTIVRDATARHLGALSALLGRFDDAECHFAAAIALDGRLASRPGRAHTQYAWARMLLARDDPGDRTRARELAASACALARALGMRALVQRVAELEASGGGRFAPNGAGPMPATPILRRDGDGWTVVYGTRTLRVRDTLGIRILARLAAEPDREIHVLDLAALRDTPPARRDRLRIRPAPDALRVDVLTGSGRAQTAQRLAELATDLAAAEAANDPGAATRARGEIEFVSAELARRAGLGRRRGRQATATVERARINVTRAVSLAVRHIAAAAPELGWLLERAVRTGTYCSFRPAPVAPSGPAGSRRAPAG